MVSHLLNASQQVPASLGDGEVLLKRAHTIATITTALINTMRTSREYLSAAKITEVEANRRADLLLEGVAELGDVMKVIILQD